MALPVPPSAWRLVTGVILASAVACSSDGTGPGPEPATGLTVIARPPAGDTVTATPVQAIVVELRDASRQLSVGTTVRFAGLQKAPGSTVLTMLVRLPTGTSYGGFVAAQTNAQGQASAQVAYGTVAGVGRVEMTVPELGLVDTLTFNQPVALWPATRSAS